MLISIACCCGRTSGGPQGFGTHRNRINPDLRGIGSGHMTSVHEWAWGNAHGGDNKFISRLCSMVTLHLTDDHSTCETLQVTTVTSHHVALRSSWLIRLRLWVDQPRGVWVYDCYQSIQGDRTAAAVPPDMADLYYFPLVFPTILVILYMLRSFDWPLWCGQAFTCVYMMFLISYTEQIIRMQPPNRLGAQKLSYVHMCSHKCACKHIYIQFRHVQCALLVLKFTAAWHHGVHSVCLNCSMILLEAG